MELIMLCGALDHRRPLTWRVIVPCSASTVRDSEAFLRYLSRSPPAAKSPKMNRRLHTTRVTRQSRYGTAMYLSAEV